MEMLQMDDDVWVIFGKDNTTHHFDSPYGYTTGAGDRPRLIRASASELHSYARTAARSVTSVSVADRSHRDWEC